VLRELYLADPDNVVEFIKDNYDHFSREGLRYAIEKMPDDLKTELLYYNKVKPASKKAGTKKTAATKTTKKTTTKKATTKKATPKKATAKKVTKRKATDLEDEGTKPKRRKLAKK
jgi:hypothetical protein